MSLTHFSLFSGIGGIDDLEKKWHDLQKELGE